MKLTKAQNEILVMASKFHSIYPRGRLIGPAARVCRLGLLTENGMGQTCLGYRITPAGRQALEEQS